MLGGASDSVPTVSTPGVPRPSASTLTVSSGATVGVVYLSSPGPAAAEARLVGTALALSTPGGAHWSTSAPAGAAIGRLNTSSATSDRTSALRYPARESGHGSNVAAAVAQASAWLNQNATDGCLARLDGLNTPRRTSSATMIRPIASDRPAHAARAPSGSPAWTAAVSAS